MCANQIGKTYCGAMETAMHLTGLYPDWWEGHRFTKPVNWLVGSNTNETARDICQKELFGDPSDDDAIGTGTIPKDCIGIPTRKPGVPNAIDSCLVKHASGGWSKVNIRAYEQGPKKFMGHRYDGAWPDEEPPQEIQSQILRSMFSTNGIELITFTPEEGVTEVVNGFVNDPKPGQALITATWDDAPHMTEELIEQKLASISPHEREMRTKGIPLMGSGLVFEIAEDEIVIDPIEIPKHWPRINGFDIGWDHPSAGSAISWDRDTDTVYVYAEYRESKARMALVADAIKRWGSWIPIAWPHDGLIHDKKSGIPLADIYRDEYGMNLLQNQFSNPPQDGKKEGTGGNGVDVGLIEIYNRMITGRFKILKTCPLHLEEMRMYHRKNGKLVALRDDLMSSMRYATMMLRHAQVETVKIRKQKIRRGARNW
jgi:phage terminase large subunit-like protein